VKHESDPRRTGHHVYQSQIHDEGGVVLSKAEKGVQSERDQKRDGSDSIGGPELGPARVLGTGEVSGQMPHGRPEEPQCSADQRQDLQPTGGLTK
jgi:hypothetical protein